MHEPDTLPGVFFVEAHGHTHVRARCEIERMKSHAFDDRSDLKNLGRVQAGGAPQALIAIPYRYDDELDVSHHNLLKRSARAPGLILPDRCESLRLSPEAHSARVATRPCPLRRVRMRACSSVPSADSGWSQHLQCGNSTARFSCARGIRYGPRR